MGKDLTAEQRLIEVNNAISNILVGGQSYKIGSRSLTRADLDQAHLEVTSRFGYSYEMTRRYGFY